MDSGTRKCLDTSGLSASYHKQGLGDGG